MEQAQRASDGLVTGFGLGLTQATFLAHVGFGFLGLSYLTKTMVHLRLCLCLANLWLVAWGVVALSGEAAWAAAGCASALEVKAHGCLWLTVSGSNHDAQLECTLLSE